MQIRTESGLRLLLDLWQGRMDAVLSFTEIKKSLGWGAKKTTDALRRAQKGGFVEAVSKEGRAGYRNRIADYTGYFNAIEFLAQVDKKSRVRGNMRSVGEHLIKFPTVSILEYGIPNQVSLTPLELEFLRQINSKLAESFSEYVRFCRAVEKREKLEKLTILPDSVKHELFPDNSTERVAKPNIRAVAAIYGDVLWEHIFAKTVSGVRFGLVQGSMDTVGPLQLILAHDMLIQTASEIGELALKGKLDVGMDTDPRTTARIMDAASSPTVDSLELNPPKIQDYAVLLTPSPDVMGDYRTEVGKIVSDRYDFWKDFLSPVATVFKKGANRWDDVIQARGEQKTRREFLADDLIDSLTLERVKLTEPIDQITRQFMLRDRNLLEAFNLERITVIADYINTLIRRAKKFEKARHEGASDLQLRKDPEWFSNEELKRFKLLEIGISMEFLGELDQDKVKRTLQKEKAFFERLARNSLSRRPLKPRTRKTRGTGFKPRKT